MIAVKKEGILLHKTNLDFENEGVLNPGAIREGDHVHLFYRAVSNGNHSSIGYCKLQGPLNVESRMEAALLSPEYPYESQGMEDPRIVKIDDLYYLTYTAYDGVNALGALALSSDLIHFKKQGIIVPQLTYLEFNDLLDSKESPSPDYIRYNEHIQQLEVFGKEQLVWDKNVIFFPRRINGKLHFLHRIKPDIQIVVSILSLDELNNAFWKEYIKALDDCIVLQPKYDHERSYIGGGCPPIETPEGWLMIYHGVCSSAKGYVYSACAALLDLNNPQKELARLPYALFKPEYEWELKGEVNNVCFPTGSVVIDNILYIYYGAADQRIAVASINLTDLLAELLLYSLAH